jgi:hypothetical protein
MKLEFDDLKLVEVKLLADALAMFRAGQPFSWNPAPSRPVAVPAEPKKEHD